jgi:hypothetical protein
MELGTTTRQRRRLFGLFLCICIRFQLVNRFSEAFRIRAGHLGLQGIERNVEVVRYVRGGDKLAEVLEAAGGGFQVDVRAAASAGGP